MGEDQTGSWMAARKLAHVAVAEVRRPRVRAAALDDGDVTAVEQAVDPRAGGRVSRVAELHLSIIEDITNRGSGIVIAVVVLDLVHLDLVVLCLDPLTGLDGHVL